MPRNRPNVLFILCDDLNDTIAGMGGHPQARTPNIDKLMARGVRFTNGQANAPICGPSRASCLSGLSPWTTGYFGYNFTRDSWANNPILGKQPTFMEHAGANGYGVYGTGKIFHNGHEKQSVWNREYGHLVDWGPYSWDGHKGDDGWCVGWGTDCGLPGKPGCINAENNYGSLDDVPRFPDYEGWRNGDGTPFRYVNRNDRDLMHDEKNGLWAAEVLSRPHAEEPFLLCLGIGKPHSPVISPQEYFDLFPLDEVNISPFIQEGDIEDCGQVFRDGHTSTGVWGFEKYKVCADAMGPGHEEEMLRKWTQAYLACVAYADACIGTALDALWKSPHADNTHVILSSDNGYHMGEKDYLFKNSLWDRSCRVPFIVSSPDGARGAECRQPVSLLDVFPTLVDWCGLPEETGALPLDGRTLAPLVRDPEGCWDGPACAVSAIASDTPVDAGTPADRQDQHYSVRSATHRYIRYHNGEEELYDHTADPCEWTNRAGDPALAEVKAGLKAALAAQVGLAL